MKKNNDANSYHMYGKHATLAALANKKRKIEKIFCTERVFNENQSIIEKFKYELVNQDFFIKNLAPNANHQGIVIKTETIFSDSIKDIDMSKDKCTIGILDQITDTQNIGSIIRSAAAFNVDAIIIPADNSANENAVIAKAASGSLELVQIVRVVNLKNSMEYLKKAGFWIIGLDSESDTILNSKILSNKIAIVLGSEDRGMRQLTKSTCDYVAKIPMEKNVESINVSQAASIAFYLSYTFSNE